MLIEITYNVTDVYMSTTETPVYVEISFEQPGGSAAVWGSITGTLSNQTDLQNALNLKVPYTGATTNVNLGEYELKAGQVTLDTSPTGTAAVGTIRWNDTTGTSETTLKGGNVILKNGVDLVARVVNKVTPNTTLTKAAYQAVRVSGAQGQRLAIELAQANNDTNSADTIGLVIETIPTNQEGFIMTVGQLEGINTTGSLQGETWVDGDVLYLSPTTAGAITNVKPTAVTGHIVVIGYVEYAHANNGKIYVKVMNGWELDELHNVSIVTPTNNQGLFYNSSNSLWENKTISTALGYTPVPTTRNITINGVTYDLSADRTYTISTGISGSGASGQVTYWTGASAVSGSNNLFWDNTNGRLGIGTNAPLSRMHILPATNATSCIIIEEPNTTPNGLGQTNIYITGKGQTTSGSNNSEFAFLVGGPGSTTTTDGPAFAMRGNNFIRNANQRGCILFYSGNPSSPVGNDGAIFFGATTFFDIQTGTNYTSKLRVLNTGNVLIQNGGTFTDNGQRLQVYGDTLLRGSGSTIATTALTVQNSSSTNLLRVLNDGDVSFGADAFYWDNTNSRLGIGTNAPLSRLHLKPTTTATSAIIIEHPETTPSAFGRTNIYITGNGQTTTGANNAEFSFSVAGPGSGSGTDGPYFFARGNNYSRIANQRGLLGFVAGNVSTPTGLDGSLYFLAESSFIDFMTGLSATSRLRIHNDGNVGIGFGATNPAVRLGVSGDTLLRGSGATSATTALTVQNSSSTNLFRVLNDGKINFSNTGIPANTSIFVNIANGYVNYGSSYSNAPFFTYQAYGSWESIGADSSTGTILAVGGYRASQWAGITLHANGNEIMRVKQNGQVRFVPLASAPASPQAGDVYYDSTLNKLRVYTTAWETITSI